MIMLVAVAMAAVAGDNVRPPKDLIPLFKGEESGQSNRAAEQNEEVKYLDITLAHAGELASKLGDDTSVLDSLVVRGPVNAADFRAMFLASVERKLSAINLEFADIENATIPANAFWDYEYQQIPGTYYYNCIFLRRIIFPEGLKEIGNRAFSFAKRLETINIPSTMLRIGNAAFSICDNLNASPMIFPEGMTEIGDQAFSGSNYVLNKDKNDWRDLEVIIPGTVKKIGFAAFESCHITNLILEEGIESIGKAAFLGSAMKEVTIPMSCTEIGAHAFSVNYKLEKMSLPESLTIIPEDFVATCPELKSINLPDGLKRIERQAFEECNKLTEICFPASLEYLGAGSCTTFRKIYCKATMPPVCGEDPYISKRGPFSVPLGSNGIIQYPLYIPKGTLEKYVSTLGWENFCNIIETEEFPAGLDDVVVDSATEDQTIYDMMGRRVLNPVPGQLYIRGGKKIVFPAI